MHVVLLLLSALAFAPLLQSDFLWSDHDRIDRTAYQSMERWQEAWQPDALKRYDPLSVTSYFLESSIPLPQPLAHRLINLLLHLSAALILLKVLESLKLRGAFAASLLFALHPAVVPTLFWPGYRSELVGLVFILISLFFAIRNRSSRDVLLAIVFSLISSLLHPAALALPLLAALAIFYQNRSVHLHHYNRVLPLFCIVLFAGVWTQSGQLEQTVATEEINAFTLVGQNLVFYLQQSFLPFTLQLFHPFTEGQRYSVGAANSLLAFLVFIPFYVLIAFNFRKLWARGILFGVTSFILLIIYGLLQTGRFIDGSLAKETYALYVALPPAMAMAICGAAGFFEHRKPFGRMMWFTFFGGILLLQISLTASFSYAVGQPPRMWQFIAEEWDDSWVAKAALVDSVIRSESDLIGESEIIRTLEEILEASPDQHGERLLLARAYQDAGQSRNALREYRYLLRESTPSNELLEESAKLMDSLGLSWEANNARERINN